MPQFLLIIDRRRMDFGAHDVEKNRRFTSPTTAPMCCWRCRCRNPAPWCSGAGKGVSYEYEYFAYAGPLKGGREFCLPDGSLWYIAKLASHLATRHGRCVFSYSGSEFADMVRRLQSQSSAAHKTSACSAWSTPVMPASSSVLLHAAAGQSCGPAR